jgi:septin family protein
VDTHRSSKHPKESRLTPKQAEQLDRLAELSRVVPVGEMLDAFAEQELAETKAAIEALKAPRKPR